MRKFKSIAKGVLLIAISLTLLMLPGLKAPYIDKKADSYFSETLTKAAVAYGVCRGINASVSVIKDSQLEIEPAGLGVAIAAGQVLDPLDDMTERASDILVTAIVSLGIQKIAYELSVKFAPVLVGILLLAFVLLSFFRGGKASATRAIVLNSIIIIAAARLCLPTSSMLSFYLNDHYFSPETSKVKDELAMSSPELDRFKEMQMPETDGVLGTVKNGFSFVKEKTSDLGAVLKETVRRGDSMISNLLQLSYLYVALFVIQVILLPIGVFWLLARITSSLLGTNVPYILRHADLGKSVKGRAEVEEA